MNITIEKMKSKYKDEITEMMKEFYSSDAVSTNGSYEIFSNDIDECVSNSQYLEGYVFKCENKLAGYAMLAKSFSTEFGKPCIWIEDIFIKKEYRKKGIGKMFFDYIFEKYKGKVFRLEVEHENENALKLYKKSGFDFLPYAEMIKFK